MSPVILRRFDLVIGPTSFNDLSLKASVLLVIGAFLLLVSLSRQPFKNWVGRRNIPVIGEAGTKDFRSTIATGCQKYQDRPFLIPFRQPTVIIPPSAVEYIKNLPDSTVSTNGSQYDRFAVRWTNSGLVHQQLAESIRYDLARETNGLLPTVQRQIEATAQAMIPDCSEWTSVNTQATLVTTVASVFGRVVVGLPHSQTPEWLEASIGHAISVVMFAFRLERFPSFVRPIVAYFLPERAKLLQTNEAIASTVQALVQSSLVMKGEREEDPEHHADTSPDEGKLVKWLLHRYDKSMGSKQLASSIIRDHLSLCFAAIHGPTFLLMQALIDIAAYPQYLKPLRAEIDRELKDKPCDELDLQAIARMPLLDSFCKESARMNPQGLIAFLRKTHKPIPLPSGHTIPANTLIAACNPFFNDAATDFVNPEVFDPYRFMKLRTDSQEAGKYAFSSSSVDSLIFGYGRHACPGRQFGTCQVKLTLAHIISRYDVRLNGGSVGRPQNVYDDWVSLPPAADVQFKKREL